MLSPASSLAFRSLLKSGAIRAELGRTSARVTGLTPAATALHAAALAQDAPVFLVVPTDADVERLTADARFFLSSLQGLSDADAERQVLPFPSQEVDPYRGLAPHLEVASARARALHALAGGTARIVVASARALMPRLSDPMRLRATSIAISPGLEISPQELGERLALAGFSPEDPVDEHGEFCVRGGVVDIYPAAESQPVRLEFIGDMVESLRRYDASTQRSLTALDQIVISPQRELLPDPAHEDDPNAFDRSSTVIDYIRTAGATLVVFEIDDVSDRGAKLEEQWRASEADMQMRGRTVPAYDTLALAWPDVAPWISVGRRVSELAIEEGAADVVHVACRPSVEYHGRIAE